MIMNDGVHFLDLLDLIQTDLARRTSLRISSLSRLVLPVRGNVPDTDCLKLSLLLWCAFFCKSSRSGNEWYTVIWMKGYRSRYFIALVAVLLKLCNGKLAYVCFLLFLLLLLQLLLCCYCCCVVVVIVVVLFLLSFYCRCRTFCFCCYCSCCSRVVVVDVTLVVVVVVVL